MNGQSHSATPTASSTPQKKPGNRKVSPIYTDSPHDGGPSTVSREVTRKRLVFGWYGGKFSHLDWLLPLLPEAHHYCEPFAGSAAVLINRPPAPIETYNDIDGDVVNLFRALRDSPTELIRSIGLTPFSRTEFYDAIYEEEGAQTSVERARRFYVRARQARTGLAQTATLGRWANCIDTSRGGMSGVVSRWFGGLVDLEAVAKRLLRVQIENRPALDVIRLYDSPETLFYCDPPYLHETRGDSHAYSYEMDETAHRDLALVLQSAQGKVATSGYRCDLNDALYAGWTRFDAPIKQAHSVKQDRQECLWMNY